MAAALYNGKLYTRKTARVYTHAVGVTHAVKQAWHKDADGIAAWCGSIELAQKAARKYSAPQFGFSRIEIVEVLS